MNSMTGYARRESERADSYVMVELKSFNNRYLDLHVNTPAALSALEPRIREMIGASVQRGKIDCTIRYRTPETVGGVIFDKNAVESLVDSLRSLRDITHIDEEIHISHVLRYDEQIRAERPVDTESAWMAISKELQIALQDLSVERKREGDTVFAVVEAQLAVVESTLALFVSQAKILDQTIREQVRERFEEVVGNRIDEDRLLAEIASLLLKFSIDEEIVRLRGHLDAFVIAMKSDGPVGKKLDFLCQELNREVNTIGSKSPLYEINRHVVEAKDAIEKMREQLRNVE